MKKLKKLAPLGVVILLVIASIEIRNRPQPLEKILNDIQGNDFWNQTTVCTVEDDGYYEMCFDTELVLGDAFEGVWVRGPYPTKTTAIAGGSLDVYAVLPDSGHPDGGPHVNMDVFWEKTDTRGGMKYSFNIDAREWVVVRGGEKIDAFVKEMHDMRYQLLYP